ncbi:MAG: hypothetical protein ACTHN0_16045 [Aquihabitans sp.]
MSVTRRLAPLALVLALSAPFVASCSSDTKENAKDTAESLKDDAKDNAETASSEVEKTGDEAQARAAAEDLRARIKANDTANDEGARSVAAINESLQDVAGDPELEGLEDGDGDGLDDDGKVQINIEDSSACLTLPKSGEDTTVEGGAC